MPTLEFGLDTFLPVTVDQAGLPITGDQVIRNTVAEAVLADIRDRPRIRAIFERYRPHVVFHAAAHKHVPILERHPVEAAHTNLLGTWWLARVAAEPGHIPLSQSW